MRYNVKNFIREYSIDRRRKSKPLRTERIPIRRKMRRLLRYISYFLRDTYDSETHVSYLTHLTRIRDNGNRRMSAITLKMHNISFSVENNFFILEIGRCDIGIGAMSLRLYDNQKGLKALASESITLDCHTVEKYAKCLDSLAKRLAKKLFPDDVAAYFVVQGINIREIYNG